LLNIFLFIEVLLSWQQYNRT